MTDTQRQALRAVECRVHNQESFGTVDGPGVRYVFFLQGCPLKCLYCHNVDSTLFDRGEVWTAGQVVDEILKYRKFIVHGGVTFSGGEPLAQSEFLVAAIKLLKEQGIHTVIDTSGCYKLSQPFVQEAIDLADLILLDIKSVDPLVSVELSGRESENAFAILDHCEKTGKDVWVRQVLVQGYTLDALQLDTLARRLSEYSCVKNIELLPFHKLGEHKWEDMAREYLLSDTPATTKEEVLWAKEIFARYGLKAI